MLQTGHHFLTLTDPASLYHHPTPRPLNFRQRRLEEEMKKQRLKFRFYRDYFGRPEVQRELKEKPLIHYKLRYLLEGIRREIKECLYPPNVEEEQRELNKFEHLLIIESYLERLELIKCTRLKAFESTGVAKLVTNS